MFIVNVPTFGITLTPGEPAVTVIGAVIPDTLNSVTVNVSLSKSVSFLSTKPSAFATVKVVSSFTDAVSGFATGRSLTELIVIISFAVAVSPFPSLIM